MTKLNSPCSLRHLALRASFLCIAANLALAVLKLICGIVGDAPALFSDAMHSLSDLISTVVVCIGIRLASAPPDAHHPYGHERFESIASILLSGILFLAGLGIGLGGIRSIVSGAYRAAETPKAIAVWVAVCAVIAKLVLALYMRAVSKKAFAPSLRADAVHQLSDALASLGALCGILASRLGFPVFDPIASVFISLFLFQTAAGIFAESAAAVVDRAIDMESEKILRGEIAAVAEDATLSSLRTRRCGAGYYVDAELKMDGSSQLSESERISEHIKAYVKEAHPEIRECNILIVPRAP